MHKYKFAITADVTDVTVCPFDLIIRLSHGYTLLLHKVEIVSYVDTDECIFVAGHWNREDGE